MSKNLNFTDTSANRYSLALYELAQEDGSLNEIEKNSIFLKKNLFSNQDFNTLIKNPTIKKEQLQSTLKEISKNLELNELLTKFLIFLVSKRRFFFVDKIINNFIEICSSKRGEMKAELTSAKELSENEINSLKEELTKNFSSKIKLNYKYDPSLIGGLIVQVGSTMIDTSIKNKLQKIEKQMIEA